ncbi:MAG: hypothetical protein HY293_00495 [Planctomycetes bacterium]|nr:hypothetical protein [Planctomycetota bacterium]
MGLLLAAAAGCASAPAKAPWKQDEKTIQPGAADGGARGRLLVETVFLGMDNESELHNPFWVYDEQGRCIDRFPNHSMSPVSLPAGRYVVVTTILLAPRRVQVVVENGRTTRVTLEDFKKAPEAAVEAGRDRS